MSYEAKDVSKVCNVLLDCCTEMGSLSFSYPIGIQSLTEKTLRLGGDCTPNHPVTFGDRIPRDRCHPWN